MSRESKGSVDAKRVALIGECMIELNGEPFGTMTQSFGGDSFNTAFYLKQAAGDAPLSVYYVSVMGADALSRGIVSRWQAAGIDTSFVLEDSQRQPGLYLIQLDPHGERTFLYWRENSAARHLVRHPSFARIAEALPTMDAVYLSGISLAVLPPEDRETLLALLVAAKRQGVQIVFDGNYRPALWKDPEEARTLYQALFSVTSLALMTDDDERLLWGDATPKDTLARLKAAGVEEAVVKMGAQGCVYQHLAREGAVHLVPAFPVATVVDTTAAGDSFNGAFLAGRLAGRTPEVCARMGHRLASVVIQHQGAIIAESATRAAVDALALAFADPAPTESGK